MSGEKLSKMLKYKRFQYAREELASKYNKRISNYVSMYVHFVATQQATTKKQVGSEMSECPSLPYLCT